VIQCPIRLEKSSISQLFPEYYIIRINEFNDIAKDGLDEWIYFLKNESIPVSAKAKGLAEAKKQLDILKLSSEERHSYNSYKENQRYQISLLEGSIRRAERETLLRKAEESLRKEEESKRKAEESLRKEEESKRKAEESLRKAEESLRKEEEQKRVLAEEKLTKALSHMIAKGMTEAEAKEILGIS
jgi:hypothetical protein